MAQTKRKRRSKHRGTAAGNIEARGRTGRPPSAEERKKAAKAQARGSRQLRPPTWNAAFLKAAFMAALLFILVQVGLFGQDSTTAQALFLSAAALLVYTPLAYVTDRAVYRRLLKKQQQGR
jgi:hypothetical protein